MRKEKFSYIILIAEIAAIIWLHSVKSPDNKELTPGNIVDYKTAVPPAPSGVTYIQAVHK